MVGAQKVPPHPNRGMTRKKMRIRRGIGISLAKNRYTSVAEGVEIYRKHGFFIQKVGMLNRMGDKNEGTYQGGGGEGKTPMTTDLSKRSLRVKSCYELTWKPKKRK